MYDNICKFIAEEFSEDISSWLLGRSIRLTQLSPSELSLEPIRADSLILQSDDELVLHLEFQTEPDADIPFRMADYRLRVYRRFPDKKMRQAVIYLKRTNSDLVYQNAFVLSDTRHKFQVIRLWEQPTEIFLNAPGLLPFAALSSSDNRKIALNQVARAIEGIGERRAQANLSAASGILAGLVLKKDIIASILRSDIMKESVIYQEWQKEFTEKGRLQGLETGLKQGLKQGRLEAMEQVALNLLQSGMSAEQIASVTGLDVERIQELGEESE